MRTYMTVDAEKVHVKCIADMVIKRARNVKNDGVISEMSKVLEIQTRIEEEVAQYEVTGRTLPVTNRAQSIYSHSQPTASLSAVDDPWTAFDAEINSGRGSAWQRDQQRTESQQWQPGQRSWQ